MNNELKTLYLMQKIDDKVAQKLILTTNLPQKLNTLIENQKTAKNDFEQTKILLDNNLKIQKMKEIESKDNKDKIAKYKNQLLIIKTNKEYKALNSEIGHLERKNEEIDDLRVEMMLEEEKFREILKNQIEAQKIADNALKENKEKILKEISKVKKDIENLKAERNELGKKNLDIRLFKRYASLIKSKNKKAVVSNENGACSGCGFKIRPQMIIEIRKGEKIISCEYCGRILVEEPEQNQ